MLQDSATELLNQLKQIVQKCDDKDFTRVLPELGATQRMSSSFCRELAYNIEDAIHQMTLLKVAVKQTLSYMELPSNSGVATSTIRCEAGSNA